MITKEEFEALKPFERGYYTYMYGEREDQPNIPDENNPYIEGTDDYNEWKRGQWSAYIDVFGYRRMTPTEYKDKKLPFEKKLKKLYEKEEALEKRLSELEDEFIKAGQCDHSEYSNHEYEWDDGYGTQKIRTYKKCKLCHMINVWGTWHEDH